MRIHVHSLICSPCTFVCSGIGPGAFTEFGHFWWDSLTRNTRDWIQDLQFAKLVPHHWAVSSPQVILVNFIPSYTMLSIVVLNWQPPLGINPSEFSGTVLLLLYLHSTINLHGALQSKKTKNKKNRPYKLNFAIREERGGHKQWKNVFNSRYTCLGSVSV